MASYDGVVFKCHFNLQTRPSSLPSCLCEEIFIEDLPYAGQCCRPWGSSSENSSPFHVGVCFRGETSTMVAVPGGSDARKKTDTGVSQSEGSISEW